MAGIQLASGFDLNSPTPLDSRTQVDTIALRDAIPSGSRYEGLMVYVKADKKYYSLKGGVANSNWSVVGEGGGTVDTTNLATKDELDEKADSATVETISSEVESIALQKEQVSTLNIFTTDKKIDSLTYKTEYYGFINWFKNPSTPIEKVRVFADVQTANVAYTLNIKKVDNATVLKTASNTPTAVGPQWIEFTIDSPQVFQGETEILIEVRSANKMTYLSDSFNLSNHAAAGTGKVNRFYQNPTGNVSYTVNPVNGYYMILEAETTSLNVMPPDNSISLQKLSKEVKDVLAITQKTSLDLFMPSKVYTWGDGFEGDYKGEKVPNVGIYLDHAIPASVTNEQLKGIRFEGANQVNRLEFRTPYPIDYDTTKINNSLPKQEITRNYKILGDNIYSYSGSVKHISVRNDVGADKHVALLTMGDSTVEGANAFITTEDGQVIWGTFWHEVARMFARDSIVAGDATKYKFSALGTWQKNGSGPETVNYKGFSRQINPSSSGLSGTKLADHMRYIVTRRPNQANWDALGLGNGTGTDFTNSAAQKDLMAKTCEVYTGTEAAYSGNPFFDGTKTGTNRLSFTRFIERYRTLDDNGNKLTLGQGTGTKITAENLERINVCKPTHILLQTGLNDWSQVSVEQYLADMTEFVNEVKTQLPGTKIAITLFPDDTGTYFKELYPDIFDVSMRALHNQTRPYVKGLNELFKNSTDVDLLPFYFVMPPAVSMSYRYILNDDGRRVKVPFGAASNDYHANGYAHKAWANQTYAWIKSTLVQ